MQLSVTDVMQMFHSNKKNQSPKLYEKKAKVSKNPAFCLALKNGSHFAQKKLGISSEQSGLRLYESHTGKNIYFRNSRLLTLQIGKVSIVGKIDGMTDDDIIVEHNRRCRGLHGKVHFSERIQCMIYMKMLGVDTAHLIETFGDHFNIHTVQFDDALWNVICKKVNLMV